MKKSRYSDEQIVRILREADRDTIPEVAKRNGVSEASIYAWRKRFGEMVSDDVKRLKTLEAENPRLKLLLAESLLVNAGLNLTHLPAYRRSKSDPPRLRVTRRLSRLRV
ncbi:Transposase [Pandoraea pnomenusa]|uniref:Transposase n=1 Tax=Pandoraea pnomenusa TaxID=93220 RepID=A0A378YHZ9_9BURK|nr:Transposase [Pandoraea pnomenusa]